MSINENILSYIEFYSRNKIVFYKNEIPGIKFLDVGKILSKEIDEILFDNQISLKTHFIIEELFSSSITNDSGYGKYLAIQNVGILFETELKTDFLQILDKYSSSNTLFVKWDGEIENGILYFLTKEKGQKIDIKNLSHIVI